MKNTKNANAKSHIEIECRNISVTDLVASRKLFYIEYSSGMIDHLGD